MNYFLRFSVISVIVLLCSCKPSPYVSYRKTVENGIIAVPHVSEVTMLFSNAPIDHFIGQYSWDSAGPVMWNSQVLFGGRYEFTYQVPVRVNYSKCVILGITGRPQFYLVEISDTDGSATSFSGDWKLDETQWEKIVAAKGDFSVVGIQLKTNQPVANWETYVKVSRARWKRFNP